MSPLSCAVFLLNSFYTFTYSYEGPKIQSKIQIVFINGNKLGCFINENVLNPKTVQLIAKLCPPFCFAKRGPIVSLTQGEKKVPGQNQ